MAGKTIKLYISGEEQKNLKSAELSNWSGKAFIGGRKNVPIIQKMEELSSPGIYFLISKNLTDTQITLYVGEADEVNSRLRNHLSGKDWWDTFVCFISKDGNLTKAHVKDIWKNVFIKLLKKIQLHLIYRIHLNRLDQNFRKAILMI